MKGRIAPWLVVGVFWSLGADAQTAEQEQAVNEAIVKLNWQTGAVAHVISTSHAQVEVREDEALLDAKDAAEFLRLTQGHDGFQPDALVYKVDGPLLDSFVTYEFNEVGYVEMDDWEETIDADDIMAEIKQGTEAQNAKRAEGYAKLTIDGWVEKPHLDRERAIVYWALKLHDEHGNQSINAKAMKLGRKGISDIDWTGSPDQFVDATHALEPAIQVYNYQDGFRYADFKPGVDTVAAFGIGAIAYQMLTGNAKKTGVIAGILAAVVLFAKKLWFLIVLPFVFAWKWIKGRFGT